MTDMNSSSSPEYSSCGTLVLTGTGSFQLSGPISCHTAIIQASKLNKAIIWWGNNKGQFIELAPGESVQLDTNNPKCIWFRGDGKNTYTVNWLTLN